MEEDEIQNGDWVVCVDATGVRDRLTDNKEYQVLGSSKTITTVVDDIRKVTRWFTFRFKKVRSRITDTEEMIDADSNN